MEVGRASTQVCEDGTYRQHSRLAELDDKLHRMVRNGSDGAIANVKLAGFGCMLFSGHPTTWHRVAKYAVILHSVEGVEGHGNRVFVVTVTDMEPSFTRLTR